MDVQNLSQATFPTLLTLQRETDIKARLSLPTQTMDDNRDVGKALPKAPTPLPDAFTPSFRIRNTFIDSTLQRSPSLEGFYQERDVHTCPSSKIGRLTNLFGDLERHSLSHTAADSAGLHSGQDPAQGGSCATRLCGAGLASNPSARPGATEAHASACAGSAATFAASYAKYRQQQRAMDSGGFGSPTMPSLRRSHAVHRLPPAMSSKSTNSLCLGDGLARFPGRATVLSLNERIEDGREGTTLQQATGQVPAAGDARMDCRGRAQQPESRDVLRCSQERPSQPRRSAIPQACASQSGGVAADAAYLYPSCASYQANAVPVLGTDGRPSADAAAAARFAAQPMPACFYNTVPPQQPLAGPHLTAANVGCGVFGFCGDARAPAIAAQHPPVVGPPYPVPVYCSPAMAPVHPTTLSSAGPPTPQPLQKVELRAQVDAVWQDPGAGRLRTAFDLGHLNTIAEPPAAPAPGSAQLPSVGSAAHASGRCKPCAFVHNKGCENGAVCQFCHICEPGEKKRRHKEKLALRRQQKQEQAFKKSMMKPSVGGA